MRSHLFARFHLDRHHLAAPPFHQEVHFANAVRLVIPQRNVQRGKLLGDHVFVHAAAIRVLPVKINRTRGALRVTRHQHARVGLIQLELRSLLRAFQRAAGLRRLKNLQANPRVHQP